MNSQLNTDFSKERVTIVIMGLGMSLLENNKKYFIGNVVCVAVVAFLSFDVYWLFMYPVFCAYPCHHHFILSCELR